MSEQEYLVLDELYFLQSFHELLDQTSMPEDELKQLLACLLEKGWIKCMSSREGEEPVGKDEFGSNFASLQYLATKAGLLAHNSR